MGAGPRSHPAGPPGGAARKAQALFEQVSGVLTMLVRIARAFGINVMLPELHDVKVNGKKRSNMAKKRWIVWLNFEGRPSSLCRA